MAIFAVASSSWIMDKKQLEIENGLRSLQSRFDSRASASRRDPLTRSHAKLGFMVLLVVAKIP